MVTGRAEQLLGWPKTNSTALKEDLNCNPCNFLISRKCFSRGRRDLEWWFSSF